ARSRRLPPPEAWKKPDKWIDLSTGLPKLDVPKLVFETDDRGFINTDDVVEQVEDMFFWKDYDWPFNLNDPETAPDDHHFYFTEAEYSPRQNNGSYIPSAFRELPTVIGRMPRQFHNVFHDFTVKPCMPYMEAMEEYHSSYKLAHRAFKNLITSAKNTSQASHRFTLRQRALHEGRIVPSDPDDVVVKEMMRDFFSKHFDAYSRSIDEVMTLPERMLILPNLEGIPQQKPHLVVKKIGKYMVQSSINYMPLLRAA
ncbi:MAG: hypothetical protein JWO54_506, partial [Candidatus Saccharibacteria bacterium]|nr:hypothetical protein [Candidatus Saccharibacteria bacterium]